MAWKSVHRFARISPRKARLVADQVRGRGLNEALTTLQFSDKRAAVLIKKVVQSAMANATDQGGVSPNDLVVQTMLVDEGPTMKRWQPRARGSAYPIFKRTSHISVVLADRNQPDEAQSKKEDA